MLWKLRPIHRLLDPVQPSIFRFVLASHVFCKSASCVNTSLYTVWYIFISLCILAGTFIGKSFWFLYALSDNSIWSEVSGMTYFRVIRTQCSLSWKFSLRESEFIKFWYSETTEIQVFPFSIQNCADIFSPFQSTEMWIPSVSHRTLSGFHS